jgi:hypothetical protein
MIGIVYIRVSIINSIIYSVAVVRCDQRHRNESTKPPQVFQSFLREASLEVIATFIIICILDPPLECHDQDEQR